MNSSDTAFGATLSKYADRISDELESRISDGSPAVLYEAARHPIRAGGKRLRPTMVLLAAEALGVDADEQEAIIPAAAAVELVHTLSLVHDDLIDEDAMRRGEPAVHNEWDMPTAILAGDVLFPKAFEALLDTDAAADDLLTCQSELLKGCRQLCEGQALDRLFEQGSSPTETEYIEMARLKTGSLFAASARIGAILAEKDEVNTDRAGAYGRNLGIAYQIYHDVLDITGEAETLGKASGSNVRQGKETLITIHARQQGLDVSTLNNNAEELISAFESTGSIAYARNSAMAYARTAQRFLDPLPETTATRHLYELGGLVTNRVR